MSVSNQILSDLLSGRATSGAIAEHLNEQPAAVYSTLRAYQTEGRVAAKPLFPECEWRLIAWDLTDKGRIEIQA